MPSPGEVDVLAALVLERTGISMEGYRRDDLLRVLPLLESRHGGIGALCDGVRLGLEPVLEDVVRAVTIGETSFFRHADQFRALEEQILPGLITARRADGSRRIDFWSAGCATGEEAYSIAIVAAGLIHDIDRWRLNIRGTDINPDSLKAAGEASYGAWSFRDAPQDLLRHFTAEGRRWRLNEDVRRLVTFERLNLVVDDYPSDVDVIFCRNVVIYFDAATRARVIGRLRDALAPGGILVGGPADLYMDADAGLEPCLAPELSIQRRVVPRTLSRPEPEPAGEGPVAGAARAPGTNRVASTPRYDLGGDARTLFERGVKALHCNDVETAEEALRRSLYLEPRQPAAHYLAGVIASRRGARRLAERHFRAARITLAGLEDTVVVNGTGITALRLRQNVDALLEGNGEAVHAQGI